MRKYRFSQKSIGNLTTCTLNIQLVLSEALARGLIDFGILWGHRSEFEQDKVYPKYSNAPWPTSKHNRIPSLAVDVFPWINGHIPWEEDDPDYWSWDYLAGNIMTCGEKLGLPLKWGRFFKIGKGDLGHFEEV